MDINTLVSFIPYGILPLATLLRESMVQRCYGSIAYLNKQSEKGKITYQEEKPSISVIIAAHNQAFQLNENLPIILEQDYPNFEVIVVNDCSSDHTEDVLKELSLKYKNLYHTYTLPSARYISHKKLALTLGIKASKNDWVVLTEADCTPQSNQWLSLLARNFTPQTDMVLGYCNYSKEKGFLNSRIIFDRLIEQLQISKRVVYNGLAYRGDGGNMAVRKSAFIQNEGYLKNLALKRGEDSLLVNEMAKPENTRMECNPEAVMLQEPPARLKNWITDKKFYMETRKHYNSKGRWVSRYFGLQSTINYLCWLLGAAELYWGITQQDYIHIGIAALCIITLLIGSIIPLNKSAKSVGCQTFYVTLPWREWTRPLNNLLFKMHRSFTRKDEFRRK